MWLLRRDCCGGNDSNLSVSAAKISWNDSLERLVRHNDRGKKLWTFGGRALSHGNRASDLSVEAAIEAKNCSLNLRLRRRNNPTERRSKARMTTTFEILFMVSGEKIRINWEDTSSKWRTEKHVADHKRDFNVPNKLGNVTSESKSE